MGRKRRPAAHHGVLLVDKPGGITSHDVVGRVRKALGQRQVGHTGTLDPMATGLMVVTAGKATRLGRFLEATEKAYVGEVTLGVSTDSFDADGEVVETAEVPALDPAAIEAAAASLRGEIDQRVPAFSAVKVDGQRLYKAARAAREAGAGDEAKEAAPPPVRRVTVHALDVLSVDGPRLQIHARVSKGTYIRSLAVALGDALGLPAHLSALRRTAVGDFTVAAAKAVDDPELLTALVPPAASLGFLPALHVRAEAAHHVGFGRALRVDQVRAEGAFSAGDPVRVLGPDGALLAVATAEVDEAGLTRCPGRTPALRYACVLVDSPQSPDLGSPNRENPT